MRTGSHRVTGTLLALGFLAGWLSASWTSPPAATTQTTPARPRPVAPAVDIPRVALHRVAAPDATPAARRNPFVFREGGPRGAAPRSPAFVDTAATAADTGGAVAPEAIAAPPPLPWRFVGLAHGADGASVTAIVSGRGDVHLVAVGDRLPDGAEVAALEGTRLVLHLADGSRVAFDLP